jgi:hypothetical protein
LSPEPFQTCGVVGELLHKLHHGVFRFRRFGSFGIVPIYVRHT